LVVFHQPICEKDATVKLSNLPPTFRMNMNNNI